VPIHILHVIGARPNIPKFVPLYRAFDSIKLNQLVIHSGQHYADSLTGYIFRDLDFDPAHIQLNLKVGSGSHGYQVGEMIKKLEIVFTQNHPLFVFTYGDVNSSLATAISAKQLNLSVVHIESGLRSFDRSMVEEINRTLIDHVSDLLFCTLESAVNNLLSEGISKAKINMLGNTMIDSVVYIKNKYDLSGIKKEQVGGLNEYCFVTLHRPSNIENSERWGQIKIALENLTKSIPVVVSAHPRSVGFFNQIRNIILLTDLGYKESIALQSESRFVLTDSGGLQEETTFLGIPCLTLRDNTERPETIKFGSNRLVTPNQIADYAELTRLSWNHKSDNKIKFWDGQSANRILNKFTALL